MRKDSRRRHIRSAIPEVGDHPAASGGATAHASMRSFPMRHDERMSREASNATISLDMPQRNVMSRPDSNVRLWAKLKCPALPLDLKVCVPWFQYNAALKGSTEPALGVSPFN